MPAVNTLPSWAQLPALVMTDIDGVWTDGGMYYDQRGNELKRFNTSDSAGVLFLRTLGIPIAILTGEDTHIVAARAKKLQVDYLYQGVTDKLDIALVLCEQLNVSLERVAYIGDDLNDMRLLSQVGMSGCPATAPNYVKDAVDFVTSVGGGHGAFREFIEELLRQSNNLDEVVRRVAGLDQGLAP